MKVVQGNIIDMIKNVEVDVVVHGCNCFCAMGGGIARQLADNFPDVEEIDNFVHHKYTHNIEKLGSFSTTTTNSGIMIINGYTQYYPGRDVNYNAIKDVFKKIRIMFNLNKNVKIVFPKIGCGIAGGNWEMVSQIIQKELYDFPNATLVVYNE